jgi:hydroxymethylpyrimidine pyrophosphatase-like HAD family hydrolase
MKLQVCFDIDGTLIHQAGDLIDTPRYEIIQLFQILELLGNEMFIWSGGGVAYATEWTNRLGLKAQIVEKGSFIPDIAVDDEAHESDRNLGKVNVKV